MYRTLGSASQQYNSKHEKGSSLDKGGVDVLLFVEAALDPLQQLVGSKCGGVKRKGGVGVRGAENAQECLRSICTPKTVVVQRQTTPA